ncbi:MAG: neutral/alkaline non-lysosomal ceramidase N-terminal domain-containing protein [Candidatus Hydrogenedentes bacterium]|nr:neutral/alkaline non-lysosomal ceramidase N-terminal domain-containing protein [Candidatus Hydrogenedentota bacterium]
MRKKILIGAGVVLLVVVGGCVTLVGPWPTYSSGFENARYYTSAIAAIDDHAKTSKSTSTPGPLKAGWARQSITPPAGTPLAGFGDRKGKPSTGVHDDVYVKALVLSDGDDSVAITGADILIIPNNVADLVREKVGKATPLTPNNILFNASHDHSSVGAWGPGFMGEQFSGKFDPKIITFLADAFSDAIIEAYNAQKPAGVYHDSVDAKEFIRNRVRSGAPVDSELSFMVVQQDEGDTCYVASFSAHPTVLGGGNMQVSGDYPGFLQRKIESGANAFAMYLGGAVGSMGPNAPNAPDAFGRAQAMGEALATRILQQAPKPFAKNVDIAAVGIPVEVPPLQLRLNRSWRVSPYFVNMLGIDDAAWIQSIRVGDLMLVGMPCDFSGEISVKWKAWGKTKNLALWNLSFDGDYVGYISPDEYYQGAGKGEEYEMYLMSWCGPHQEAFFTSLAKHMTEAIAPAQAPTPAS